jgi:microcystin-dependent protein
MSLQALPIAAQAALPTGMIFCWSAAALPAGALLCDGSSLLRSAYPNLFAIIGTTYGSADGTHFTLPDLRNRFPGGAGSNLGALGSVGGEARHTLSVAEMPSHSHVSPTNTSFLMQYNGVNQDTTFGGGGTYMTVQGSSTRSTGGDGDHENRPPFLALNWCIQS